MKTILAYIANSITTNSDYYRSENIETKAAPEFLIYCAIGNDQETLNLYFDYKTSVRFINRQILSLGPADDFILADKNAIELFTIGQLQDIGLNARQVNRSYQSWSR